MLVFLEGVDNEVQFFVANRPLLLGIFELAGMEDHGMGFGGLGVGLADNRCVGVRRGVSFKDCWPS